MVALAGLVQTSKEGIILPIEKYCGKVENL